jgi:4,5-dihydroxyphthalate decarboxylase
MTSTETLIRLGARPWSHLVPLALREIGGPPVEVSRRAVTPDLLAEPALDAAETSFSRYARARAAGDDRLVGIPAFVMSGFRHRCILVRAGSELTAPEQLSGARIGLTGWPDSGNTWTRAILRRAGVDLSGVTWTVAPLTADAPAGDRLGGLVPPPNVHVAGPGESLVGGLLDGTFDAVMTPFMPPGVHSAGAPGAAATGALPAGGIRPLFPDYRAAEIAYHREVGYLPGIHLLTVRREVVAARPTVLADLAGALAASKRAWWASARKLADASPWALAEVDATERLLGADWMPYGLAANARMIADFCAELHAQHLVATPIDPASLFPEYADLVESAVTAVEEAR